MPLFYFDTEIHGALHQDTEGEDFASAEAAIEHATRGAAEYGADQIRSGTLLDEEIRIVRSSDGEVLARFSVRDALIEIAKRG